MTLPEPVDYCISEIVGAIGGAEGAAFIINNARRFLHDPSCMLPQRGVTKIAALTLPETDFAFGFSDIAAHYVKRIFTQAGEAFDLRLCLKHLPDANMLSSWAVFETLDFTCEMDLESDHDIELEFSQAGRCHGFLLWLTLFVDDVEVVDILEQPDSWLPVYLGRGASQCGRCAQGTRIPPSVCQWSEPGLRH